MKHECRMAQDAGWEDELPEELRRHIERCADCRRSVEEARRARAVVRDVSVAPDAPDCRAAVMARIQPVRRRRPVWAYVCASATAAVVVVAGIVLTEPGQSPERPRIVRTERAAESPPPAVTRPTPPEVPKRIAFAQPVDIPSPPALDVKRTAERPRPKAAQPRVQPDERMLPTAQASTTVPEKAAFAQSTPPAPVPDTPSTEGTTGSISIAVKAELEPADFSYSSTIYDPTTGETVACTAERKGNTISLHLARSETDNREGEDKL
ncbi:MAG: hypothetical protein HYX78_02980 [Armatimonadetes bacterium]|nr:hypothetical protein [Armatimonadota bacterium]